MTRRDDADRRTRWATSSTGSSRRTPARNPAGRITLSDTTAGGKNHKMSLYRAPSGALVFGAGTVQWSWGLDGTHDRGGSHRGPADAAGHRQPALRHGRPAGDAAGGPGPRRSARHDGPDRRHHRSGGRGDRRRAATSRSPAPPPTSAASSPRSRCRPTAARPGAARPARRPGPTRSARPTARSPRRRAPSTTRPTSARAASVTFDVGPQACPCSIFGAVLDRRPGERHQRRRARREVPIRRRRLRSPGSASTRRAGQHGHPHRHAVVDGRGEPGDGHVRRRVGDRLAGGHLRRARSPIDADTTYVASYHTTAGNYAIGTSFATRRRRQPAAARAPGRRRRTQRRLPRTAPAASTRPLRSGRPTTSSTSSSCDQVGPDTTPPTITGSAPGPGRIRRRRRRPT